jgi:hypothetical protein
MRVTLTRVADSLFEGEEAVLHVMGWVGAPAPAWPFRGRSSVWAGDGAVKRLQG